MLIGSDGADFLDGGGSGYFLLGGLGNDIYVVNSTLDSAGELGGNGVDEVRTSVSYVLTPGADIETLRTTDDNGLASISLIGNAAGNGGRAFSGGGSVARITASIAIGTRGRDGQIWKQIN